jgi:phage gp45-like
MTQANNTIIRFKLEKTDDSGKQQRVKGTGRKREKLGGNQPRLVVLQQYGMSTHVPPGAIGTAVMLNGSPDQMLVLGFEHPDHRPAGLAEGETKQHGPAGNFALFKANGDVEIVCGGGAKIILKGGEIILDGIVRIGGADASTPASMQGTLDSAGHTDVGGFATKVFLK